MGRRPMHMQNQNNPRARATVAEGELSDDEAAAVQLKAEEGHRVCFLEVFPEEVVVVFLWVVLRQALWSLPLMGTCLSTGFETWTIDLGAGIDNVVYTPCWPVDVDCWGEGSFTVD